MKDAFKKDNMQQKEMDEDLDLLIVKNNLTIQFVKSVWFKKLAIHLCPKINFPSKRKFSQEILPNLVEKTNQLYVLLSLSKCYTIIVNFDLWMNKKIHDNIFVVIGNVL
jgi:hypothetical protein